MIAIIDNSSAFVRDARLSIVKRGELGKRTVDRKRGKKRNHPDQNEFGNLPEILGVSKCGSLMSKVKKVAL